MNDPRDHKFREVPIASFNYRHEAEFAAGFLREAGIPYRLQIDDPTLGLSVTNSATLWVTSIDERRARRVLDEDMTALDEADDSWAVAVDEGEAIAAADDAVAGDLEARRLADPGPSRRGRPSVEVTDRSPRALYAANHKSELSLRQRGLAVVMSLGVVGLLALDGVREAPAWVVWGVAVVAAAFAGVALVGRAPEPVAGFLAALSGDAP